MDGRLRFFVRSAETIQLRGRPQPNLQSDQRSEVISTSPSVSLRPKRRRASGICAFSTNHWLIGYGSERRCWCLAGPFRYRTADCGWVRRRQKAGRQRFNRRNDMMKKILLAMPALVAVVLGGFLFWGLNPDRDPNAIPSALISDPVPNFELPPVDGTKTPGLSAAALRSIGEPFLVNVFANAAKGCG